VDLRQLAREAANIEESFDLDRKKLVHEFSIKFEMQQKSIIELQQENDLLKKQSQEDVLLRVSSNSNLYSSKLKGLKQSSIETTTSNPMESQQATILDTIGNQDIMEVGIESEESPEGTEYEDGISEQDQLALDMLMSGNVNLQNLSPQELAS
jgi:hypothetical protein